MSAKLRASLGRQGNAAFLHLRQQLIVIAHGLGLSDHDIAEMLDVSVRTVANYRRAAGLPVNRKKREPHAS